VSSQLYLGLASDGGVTGLDDIWINVRERIDGHGAELVAETGHCRRWSNTGIGCGQEVAEASHTGDGCQADRWLEEGSAARSCRGGRLNTSRPRYGGAEYPRVAVGAESRGQRQSLLMTRRRVCNQSTCSKLVSNAVRRRHAVGGEGGSATLGWTDALVPASSTPRRYWRLEK
jgi:hypothetical protein